MKTYRLFNTPRTLRPIAAVLAQAAGATLAAVLTLASPQAQAANLHYALADLGGFDSWLSEDRSLTFEGTGFIGLSNDIWSGRGPAFVHTFSLEPAQFGRTLMQLDLSDLAGARIVSATLSFRLLDGQEAPGKAKIAVTGFDTGGRLGLQWDAPTHSLDAVFGDVTNATFDSQSIDISSLVRQGAQRGWNSLGLHLQNLGDDYLYTSTHDYPDMLLPDRAQVRIDVVTAAVPEPGTMVLSLAGGLMLWGYRRRRTGREWPVVEPASVVP